MPATPRPGAGIARGMRQLPADLPDDPSPEQVSAWVELAELTADGDFRQRARSMALAGTNAGVCGWRLAGEAGSAAVLGVILAALLVSLHVH